MGSDSDRWIKNPLILDSKRDFSYPFAKRKYTVWQEVKSELLKEIALLARECTWHFCLGDNHTCSRGVVGRIPEPQSALCFPL